MRNAIAIAGAAALFAACTPMQWVRDDGVVTTQAEQDLLECQRQAWSEARYRTWLHRPFGPMLMRDPFGRRFYAWPHAGFWDPFHDQFMEESRLANFCMRMKGYRLEPVAPAAK
jgi:hypothetical protein